MPDSKKIRLAKTFSRLLLEEVGEEALRTIIALNARYYDEASCHSHDFCDANVVMESAARVAGIFREEDEESADLTLWEAAWDLAKANEFYLPPRPVVEPDPASLQVVSTLTRRIA